MSSTLNWSVTDAGSVSITGVGEVAAAGTTQVFPELQLLYSNRL